MADEKKSAESSPAAEPESKVASEDVDFSTFEVQTNDRLRRKGRLPDPEPPPKPIPAEPAPARVSVPDDTSSQRLLTGEDVAEIVVQALERSRQDKPPEPEQPDPKPDLADPAYQTFADYLRASDAWHQRQLERAKKEAELSGRTAGAKEKEDEITNTRRFEELKANWESREKEVLKRHPNYLEIKKELEDTKRFPFNQAAFEYIFKSKIGPDIAVYFHSNPNEWKELIQQEPDSIRVDLRLLERELMRSMTAPQAPEAPVVSNAPPPISRLGSRAPAGDPRELAIREGDYAVFESLTNSSLIKKRRGG
jgi:hypothetical protein